MKRSPRWFFSGLAIGIGIGVMIQTHLHGTGFTAGAVFLALAVGALLRPGKP